MLCSIAIKSDLSHNEWVCLYLKTTWNSAYIEKIRTRKLNNPCLQTLIILYLKIKMKSSIFHPGINRFYSIWHATVWYCFLRCKETRLTPSIRYGTKTLISNVHLNGCTMTCKCFQSISVHCVFMQGYSNTKSDPKICSVER